MRQSLALVLMLIAAIAATAAAEPRPAPRPPAADAAAMPLVVPTAWLAAHLTDPKLVLLHVGEPGAYPAKHIPGARLVELSDIAVGNDHESPLHLELPPPDDLRRRLEALGISSDSRVVVYFGDDWVSPATRVVLTLDAAGLGAHAGLLDGGMPAWVRDGHPVTDVVPPARTGKLAALAMRPIIVDATTVVSSLGKPGFAVVDARNREFYDGAKTGGMPGHQHRPGHITGALSIPFGSVFDDRNVLRSTDELRARFARAGVQPGDTIIGYCHIGQQATAMLFAARRLGHAVLLYDGSFEDWSAHPAFPVEKAEPSADKQPAERPANQPPTDKPSANKPSIDRPSTDKPSADKQPTNKSSTDKPSADKHSTDKQSAQNPSTDKPSVDKHSADKQSAEQPADKPPTDKPSVDRHSAGKQSAEQPANKSEARP